MIEESTTPDLVRIARQAYEAMSRGDFDAVMSLFAADAVYDLSGAGLGTFEGEEAIRGFIEDWHRSWEDRRYEEEELLDLWHGVLLGVVRESGRLVGGHGRVEQRLAHSPHGRTARSSGSRTTVTSTRPVPTPNGSPRKRRSGP